MGQIPRSIERISSLLNERSCQNLILFVCIFE